MPTVPNVSTRPASSKHARVSAGKFVSGMRRALGNRYLNILERLTYDVCVQSRGIVLEREVVGLTNGNGLTFSDVRHQLRFVLPQKDLTRSRWRGPQTQIFWSLLYSTMRHVFGNLCQSCWYKLIEIYQRRDCLPPNSKGWGGVRADALNGADGIRSMARQQGWIGVGLRRALRLARPSAKHVYSYLTMPPLYIDFSSCMSLRIAYLRLTPIKIRYPKIALYRRPNSHVSTTFKVDVPYRGNA